MCFFATKSSMKIRMKRKLAVVLLICISCHIGWAAEKTLRETNKKVITNMHRKGYTLEQIAEIVEIKPEEVGKIIEEESMSV